MEVKMAGTEGSIKRILISRYGLGAAKQWVEQKEAEVLDWKYREQNRKIELNDYA
jgi:hypothetical protein